MTKKPEITQGNAQNMSLEEYKKEVYDHLTKTLKISAEVANDLMKDYEPFFREFLEDDWTIAMAATYMAHNY